MKTMPPRRRRVRTGVPVSWGVAVVGYTHENTKTGSRTILLLSDGTELPLPIERGIWRDQRGRITRTRP